MRFFTEDKLPEVYLVLDGKLGAHGEPWLHIRIPMRPNGRTGSGWVPAEMLSQLYVVRTQLVVDRAAKRSMLFEDGRKIWQAPVGIGKVGASTPRGGPASRGSAGCQDFAAAVLQHAIPLR